MPRLHWIGRSHRIVRARVQVRAVQIIETTEPTLKIGDWILVSDSDARQTPLAVLSDREMQLLFDVEEIPSPNTIRQVAPDTDAVSDGVPIEHDSALATPTTAEEVTRDDGPTAKRSSKSGAKKRR